MVGCPRRVGRDLDSPGHAGDLGAAEVAREDGAVAVHGDAVHEATGRRDLLDLAVDPDRVDLAGFSARVHAAVGSPGHALGMVEAGRDHLESIEHVHPPVLGLPVVGRDQVDEGVARSRDARRRAG